MLLGVAGNAVGKWFVGDDVHACAVDEEAAVEVVHLASKLNGVAVAVFVRHKSAVVLGFVASQHKQVVDAQEVEVDKRIFGFNLRESAANEVRHGSDVVALLNGCSHSHGARAIALRHAFVQPVGSAAVYHFAAVSGDVDV